MGKSTCQGLEVKVAPCIWGAVSSSKRCHRLRGSLEYWAGNRTSHRFAQRSRACIGQVKFVL